MEESLTKGILQSLMALWDQTLVNFGNDCDEFYTMSVHTQFYP